MGVASLRRAGFGSAGGGARCAGGGGAEWCGSSTWKLRSATSKASAASAANRLLPAAIKSLLGAAPLIGVPHPPEDVVCLARLIFRDGDRRDRYGRGGACGLLWEASYAQVARPGVDYWSRLWWRLEVQAAATHARRRDSAQSVYLSSSDAMRAQSAVVVFGLDSSLAV